MPTRTCSRGWILELGLAFLLAAAFGWPALVHAEAPGKGLVDLNTATATELEGLPGIGPAKVKLILAYRMQHRFRTVEELVRVKGLGPKSVRLLRPLLTVGSGAPAPAGGQTTAPDDLAPRMKTTAPTTPLPVKSSMPCTCQCRCTAAP